MNTPTILSDEELAPLLQRKRQLQANLASQGSCGSSSTSCCGQSGCGTSAAPSPATGKPNILKALLITGSVLAVIALAWWA